MVARIPSPNVPRRLASLTDAEFAGFLRSVPVTGPETPPNSYRLLGRLGVVLGQF